MNSEQSDAEADPSIEEGAAAREDSSDDDAADGARYFDARELQWPSRSLSDDLDAAAAAADGQASRCACATGCTLLSAFYLTLLCVSKQEAARCPTTWRRPPPRQTASRAGALVRWIMGAACVLADLAVCLTAGSQHYQPS